MLIVATDRVAPFLFFNDTATTEIYTLSLHDALPIFVAVDLRGPSPPLRGPQHDHRPPRTRGGSRPGAGLVLDRPDRSEEHTSELQSRQYLVCRLLLEKKKKVKDK